MSSFISSVQFCSVQFSHSVMTKSLWPHVTKHARLPCFHHLLEFAQTHVHRVGDDIQPSHIIQPYHIISYHLLLPSIPPSIRVFSNESVLHIRWPKYWSFIFSTSPSSEHPGLISFRTGWLDLLAVQGTLKSLLQHLSSKSPILLYSAFLIVQLSHPYTTTGKTVALTRGTFVGKITSLLFILYKYICWLILYLL